MKVENLLLFKLDDQRYALRLSVVERVLPAVEISPLPGSPECVAGVINLHGNVLPVFDFRARFEFPERPLSLSDHFIVARTARRKVALLVDEVLGVAEPRQSQIQLSQTIHPEISMLDAAIKFPDGLVFIHDLQKFLSLDEVEQLERALEPI